MLLSPILSLWNDSSVFAWGCRTIEGRECMLGKEGLNCAGIRLLTSVLFPFLLFLNFFVKRTTVTEMHTQSCMLRVRAWLNGVSYLKKWRAHWKGDSKSTLWECLNVAHAVARIEGIRTDPTGLAVKKKMCVWRGVACGRLKSGFLEKLVAFLTAKSGG